MTIMIRVTDLWDKPWLVNADRIQMIGSDENDGSKIWFADDDDNGFRVKESQAMIAHLINEQAARLLHYAGR